jgi:hypothetical protein
MALDEENKNVGRELLELYIGIINTDELEV